uniref:Uncharacterized protein n=1 Tax=Anguilla anguilla TaxID=7936 RepID=A0A0E9WV12_ANGAN
MKMLLHTRTHTGTHTHIHTHSLMSNSWIIVFFKNMCLSLIDVGYTSVEQPWKQHTLSPQGA